MSSAIRVAVLAPDDQLRLSVAEAVKADGDLVLTGTHGEPDGFLSRTDAERPDVVIVDIGQPGNATLLTLRRCKTRAPLVRILVCNVQDDTPILFEALAAGALGFLLPGSTHRDLAEAVKHLYSGGSPMSPGIARRILASFADPPDHLKLLASLSERERQVLAQLAKGLRYKEIGEVLHLSIDTVRTHVRNLYDKLQVSSRTDALNKFNRR